MIRKPMIYALLLGTARRHVAEPGSDITLREPVTP